MKKILLSAVLLVAFSFAPSFASAAELTKAEIVAMSPQLSSMFGSVNNYLTYVQMRNNTDAQLFSTYPTVLAAMSTRLGQTPAPTDTEVNNMANTVSEMQRLTAQSVSFRAQTETTMNSISSFLSTLISAIASAV